MSEHDPFRDDIGAYLLGALEAGEAAAFEGHLNDCVDCRLEIDQLAVARDALPASVDQVPPPASLRASLMEQVRLEAKPAAAREPRRVRWRRPFLARPSLAAAAAVTILAFGIAFGSLIGAAGDRGDSDPRTLAAVVDQTRMPSGEAALLLPAEGPGAQLRVEGMQPQSDKVYAVWIKRGNRVTPSSLFSVDRNGRGAAAIPDDLTGADAVMVTREPEGGSKTPSEPPVVTVPVTS